MSIPRRLGRLARGFVLNLQDDERLRETLRAGRERGETIKEVFGEAFGAAWRGATEEWRAAEEERREEERRREKSFREQRYTRSRASGWRPSATAFRKYPPEVLAAYERLGLIPGASLEEVNRRRREMVKRYHPDRFSDPQQRARAERLTAEINAAHDVVERHLSR